jgi:hypothetical protein
MVSKKSAAGVSSLQVVYVHQIRVQNKSLLTAQYSSRGRELDSRLIEPGIQTGLTEPDGFFDVSLVLDNWGYGIYSRLSHPIDRLYNTGEWNSQLTKANKQLGQSPLSLW